MYLNECSQIPWASRNMAMTRLAQNTPLRLKAYYDCNPPGMAHWTYRLFMEKRDPDRRSGVLNPGNYAAMIMNPKDNEANLPASYLEELQNMSEAMRRRFLLGQFADTSDSALWTLELLDQQRILDGKVPDMVRIVVAVDPSGASGEEDTRSDEIGIVVCGLGKDGRGYILEDLSGRMAPSMWGKAAVSAFDRWEADAIVAEENFGGAMVAEVIRGASTNPDRKVGGSVPYRAVKASRGKIARAEPIAALFEQQKVSLVGHFPEMEDQFCAMTTAGYIGSRSPDRADAAIWGLASLFPAMTRQDSANVNRSPTVNLGHTNMKRRR
jgi:predicted phage terminase large subunit-like protein